MRLCTPVPQLLCSGKNSVVQALRHQCRISQLLDDLSDKLPLLIRCIAGQHCLEVQQLLDSVLELLLRSRQVEVEMIAEGLAAAKAAYRDWCASNGRMLCLISWLPVRVQVDKKRTCLSCRA